MWKKEKSPEVEGGKRCSHHFQAPMLSAISTLEACPLCPALLVLSRTVKAGSYSEEPKQSHNMSGEHTGPGPWHPIANGSEHLHLHGEL
jgi:hypothetical protein